MFVKVPIGGMVIQMVSADARVKLFGGTMPVPVIRKQPKGKLLSRNRYSAREEKDRFIFEIVVVPEKTSAPLRSMFSRISVSVGNVSAKRIPGPMAALAS